jgi:hypothetical protein
MATWPTRWSALGKEAPVRWDLKQPRQCDFYQQIFCLKIYKRYFLVEGR